MNKARFSPTNYLSNTLILLLSICFLTVFFLSCDSGYKDDAQVWNLKERFDITKVKLDTSINQIKVGSIIDSISFIPLETTSESRIGSFEGVELWNNNIFLLDAAGHSLTAFFLNGSFLFRIDCPPDSKFSCFAIDRHNKQIVIYDSYKAQFLFYNQNGVFIRKKDIPFTFYSFTITGNSYIFFSGYKSFQILKRHLDPKKIDFDLGKSTLLFSGDSNFNATLKETLFNLDGVDNINTFSNSRSFFTIDSGSTFFTHSYSDLVFRLNGKHIEKIYQIQIPESLRYPEDYLNNPKYKNVRIVNSGRDNNKQLFWSITDVFFIDSTKFLANLRNYEYSNNYCLFDLKDKKSTFLLDNISYDSLTSYLPLTEGKFYAAQNGIVYGFLSASFLLKALKSEELQKKVKNHPQLSISLPTINNLSNGIITKIYFKKNSI